MRRLFAVSDNGGRRVPLLLAAAVLPSPLIAPIVGEASYFGSLLAIAHLAGLVFLARNVIHWPHWAWVLNQRRQIAPERVDLGAVEALAGWMALELLVALCWVFGVELLRSPELVASRVDVPSLPLSLPLPLVFLGALVLIVWAPAGLAAEAARDLDLSSNTDALRGSKLGALARRAAGPFTPHCLYREIGEWFEPKLPRRRVSGIAFAIVALLPAIAIEGAAGYIGIRGADAIEVHILGRDAASATVSSPPTLAPPNGQVAGSPGSSRGGDPASLAAPSSPSECDGVEPGEPAPQPWAEELYGLWYGTARIAGVGYVIAGCPEPAEPAPGRPGAWIQQGRCDGTLQGLGVASGDGRPAMLLQQAARAGMQLAREGVLLSASSRFRVGEGDLQVAQTTRGSYVLARPTRSAGRTIADLDAERCGAFADRNVAYVLVPPGLLGIWLAVAARGWAWPVEDSFGDDSLRSFAFLDAESGETVAHARCSGDHSCSGDLGGTPLPPSDVTTVSAETLIQLGPPP